MSPDKDLLSNMFSSFVSRKTKACTPTPSPPLSLFLSHNPSTLAPSLPSPSHSFMLHQNHEHNYQPHDLSSQPSTNHRLSRRPSPPFPSPLTTVQPNTISALESAAATTFKAITELPSSELGPLPILDLQEQSPDYFNISRTRNSKSPTKSSTSDRDRKTKFKRNQQLHITVQGDEQAGVDRLQLGSTGATSSVHGGRGSAGSVEAIATDSSAAATPFHCDRCSKAFRQRSQLSRHYLRVHERKKPFGCAHCDKCFASAFDRKRHVEVSTFLFCLHI